MKKKSAFIARLSESEAADLLEIQKLSERKQSDALRIAVRLTARVLRTAKAMQAEGSALEPVHGERIPA
jgi:hypothetical protein